MAYWPRPTRPHWQVHPGDPPELVGGLQHALGSLGAGVYLYTAFSFMVMFLYRYNVTCKTSLMSSVFSRRNIPTFMCTAAVFCAIQTVLFYYSAVDSAFLVERLNRTADLDAVLGPEPGFQQQQQQLQQQARAAEAGSAAAQAGPAAEPALPAQHQAGQSTPIGPESGAGAARQVGVFGADFSRNPMVFLAGGIFACSNLVSSVVILVASLVVACKLRGRQAGFFATGQRPIKFSWLPIW